MCPLPRGPSPSFLCCPPPAGPCLRLLLGTPAPGPLREPRSPPAPAKEARGRARHERQCISHVATWLPGDRVSASWVYPHPGFPLRLPCGCRACSREPRRAVQGSQEPADPPGSPPARACPLPLDALRGGSAGHRARWAWVPEPPGAQQMPLRWESLPPSLVLTLAQDPGPEPGGRGVRELEEPRVPGHMAHRAELPAGRAYDSSARAGTYDQPSLGTKLCGRTVAQLRSHRLWFTGPAGSCPTVRP